jgi:hypothetical protein
MKNRTCLLLALLSLAFILTSNSAIALVYQGLTNSHLGFATLSVASNQLTVGNIGTNGQDGVNIAVNPGDSLGVYWQDLGGNSNCCLPPGTYVLSQLIGTAGAVTNGVLGSTQVTQAGTSNYVITANFPSSVSTTVTLRVYNGTNLVAIASGLSGTICTVPTLPGDTEPGPGPTFPIPPDDPPAEDLGGGPIVGWSWPGPLLIAVSGGSTVTGDAVAVVSDSPVTVTSLSSVQLLASDISSIIITNEGALVSYAGLFNRSLGNATLKSVCTCCGQELCGCCGDPTSNQFIVGNIGTNGRDGVSIALNPGNNLVVGWLDLDPSNALPTGAYVQSQMIGTAGAVTNGVLGTVQCTKAGTSNYVTTADFSPLGSSTHTVQVWNGPNLVAQVTGQTGAVVATSAALVQKSSNDWQPPPFVRDEDWNNATSITISGGPTVMGTRMLIIPGGAAAVSSVSAVQILAANIPSITITGEDVSVIYAGLTHTAVGNTTLSVASNQLTVYTDSNSPPCGVNIALNGVYSLAVHWQDLDPSNALPVGAYIQRQMIGTAGAVTNGLLGWTMVTKMGTSNYVMTADFSPRESFTRTVQVWNGPNLAGQVSGQTGSVVMTSDLLCYSGSWHSDGTVDGGYDNHTGTITISGGPTVSGDKVLVIPEGGAAVSSMSAAQILTSYIPSITVTNENVSFFPTLQITSLIYWGTCQTCNHTNPTSVLLNWTTDGLTNIVQAITNSTGGYSPSNFVDLATIVVTTAATNYVDVLGATNKPTRYYRIREPLP